MRDDQAIARCQDGDRDAFRHVVERHRDVLYGTAILMTGNRAVAEEMVQEAFLSAWRGIGGFKRGQPLKPWLTRILVNGVLAQKRKRAIPTVPIADTDEPGAPSVSDQMDASESRAAGAGQARPRAATDSGAEVLLRAYRARDSQVDGSKGRDGQVAAAQGSGPAAGASGGVRIGEVDDGQTGYDRRVHRRSPA